MSTFIKLLLVGVTSLAAFAAEASVVSPRGQQVLAAHRQVAATSLVVYHRHHRRHHHVRHPAHRPAHR